MIHYYIKSLSKKVILPLALVASSLTPALAGNTTLKIQGPEGDKIAFDETKQVELMMQSTGDNVSFVEVNIDLPAGLEYVEGSFAKADIEARKEQLLIHSLDASCNLQVGIPVDAALLNSLAVTLLQSVADNPCLLLGGLAQSQLVNVMVEQLHAHVEVYRLQLATLVLVG